MPLTRHPVQGRGRAAVVNKLPCLLAEQEFPCSQWATYDKAFACAWLNSRQVVVGTKCNRLLLLDADLHRTSKTHIPQIQEVQLPSVPNQIARTTESPPEPDGMAFTFSSRFLARSGSRAGLAREGAARVVNGTAEAPASPTTLTSNCGIHSMAVSPCGELLASGGANPADCQIFRIRTDTNGVASLKPAQTLTGHKDWVFGAAWITERHVVTGSRDESMKLWCVDADSRDLICTPLQSRTEWDGKVREVKYNSSRHQITSLAVSGTVQFWDPHLNSIRAVETKYDREVVCMAVSENLVAVGSQGHIVFVDSRQHKQLPPIESMDHMNGVRSLGFLDHLLSVGSGRGQVSFYDLRASRFLSLDLDREPGSKRRRRPPYLQCGAGWLCLNDIYREHFEDADIRNACYTHAWDPTQTKLLCAGGPLAFGLRGSYMAIWE